MKHKVNIAVQVIPVAPDKNLYEIVDKAISVIQSSGVKHCVTPFETVMEGSYDELMEIIKQVQLVCYDAGSKQVLCFVKIESHGNGDVIIEDKTEKYH